MTYSLPPPKYSIHDEHPDHMDDDHHHWVNVSEIQALLEHLKPSQHCDNCGENWTPAPTGCGWDHCPCSTISRIQYEIDEQALVTWCPDMQGHKAAYIVPMLGELGSIRFDMSEPDFMQELAKTGIPPEVLGCHITWPSVHSVIVHIEELDLAFEISSKVGVSAIFLLHSIHTILHSRASEGRSLLVEYDAQDNGRIKERPRESTGVLKSLASKILHKGLIIDSLGGKCCFVGIQRWSKNPSHARIVME